MNPARASRWIQVSWLFLIFAALAGTYLRLTAIMDLPLTQFRFFVHAHSHVAMLGWVYGAFFTLLLHCYLPPALQQKKRWPILFWSAQATVLGMLLTFPVKGYWLLSIIFSTLHIFIYYGFIFLFYKGLARGPGNRHYLSWQYIKAGLFLFLISTFGPWAISIISAKGMAGSDVYFQSVYYYLHFQYNGFFTFILLGLFLWLLEKQRAALPAKTVRSAFWLLFAAIFPAYFLSLLGFDIPGALRHLATTSGLVQWAGIMALLAVFYANRKYLTEGKWNWKSLFLMAALLSLFLKFTMQLASGLPVLGKIAFRMPNTVVIGYIHLVMLGFVTCALMAILAHLKLFRLNGGPGHAGNALFLAGLIGSEVLLFLQGLIIYVYKGSVPGYPLWLFIFSLLMLGGLVLLLAQQAFGRTKGPLASENGHA